jgi:imidazolonepropionase-like amidohydrolase
VFKRAGVKMLAGSDFGGGWCIPGAALHQEFELLQDAGLSPLEILQMATLNGAKFLGHEDSMGSVAEGKRPIWCCSMLTRSQA